MYFLDIRHLECFMEVARQKNFTKAAEIVHVSQPTMSKAIKDLEATLGVTLFYRNTKFVELTDAGESILEQAQEIVSSFKNLTGKLEGLTKLQTGKIHIGLPHITAVTTFCRFLGAFKKEYPNIHIYLDEFGPKKIESAIQDGLLDVGVFTPPANSDLYEKIWFEEDFLNVIMHPTHWLTHYDVIEYKQLRDEQFVLYNNDFKLHDTIIERCEQAGFMPKIIFETSQRELMTQMVASNIGIALLPNKICETLDINSFTYRPFVDPKIYLRLALVWKKGRYLSHATKELLNFANNNYSVEKQLIENE